MARGGAAARAGDGALTRGEFDTYLLFVALVFGLLGVVNLLRPHKRLLGAASIVLGLTTMAYREGWPSLAVGVGGSAAVGLVALQARSGGRRKA